MIVAAFGSSWLVLALISSLLAFAAGRRETANLTGACLMRLLCQPNEGVSRLASRPPPRFEQDLAALFPYWVLFSAFAIGAFQAGRRVDVRRGATPLLIAAGIGTALMVGLRYEVGADWFSYQRTYESVYFMSLGQSMETSGGDPAYGFLGWLGNQLGLKVWFVNFVCGLIFCWGLFKFAAGEPNPWLTILVAVPYLIIVVAMGYTRQAVAIGIVLAGLRYIERGSIGRFAIIVIAATFFHKTALIVLPLAVSAVAQGRFLAVTILGGVGLVLYFLFLDQAVDAMVTGYLEAEYSSQGAAIRVVMNLVPAILFLLTRRHFALDPVRWRLWRNFAIASVISLGVLFMLSSSTAVDRLALYLIPLQLFVFGRLPYALSKTDRANPQVLVAVVAYSALIQFVWLTTAVHAQYWIPYRFAPLVDWGSPY